MLSAVRPECASTPVILSPINLDFTRSFGLHSTEMDQLVSCGLPQIIMDLIKSQNAKDNVHMKYKIFCSGGYTELKLQWTDMADLAANYNQVNHHIPDRARYGGYKGGRRTKPPSAYRRDAQRKAEYLNRKYNKDVISTSVQCEIDGTPNLDVTHDHCDKGTVQKKISVNQKVPVGVKTRNMAKQSDANEVPRQDLSPQSCTYILSPASVDSSIGPLSHFSSIPDTSECTGGAQGELSMGALESPDPFPNEQNTDNSQKDSPSSCEIQFKETMSCHFNNLDVHHFDNYRDMMFCEKCRIIVCKLCAKVRCVHEEHSGYLKWVSLRWDPDNLETG